MYFDSYACTKDYVLEAQSLSGFTEPGRAAALPPHGWEADLVALLGNHYMTSLPDNQTYLTLLPAD